MKQYLKALIGIAILVPLSFATHSTSLCKGLTGKPGTINKQKSGYSEIEVKTWILTTKLDF